MCRNLTSTKQASLPASASPRHGVPLSMLSDPAFCTRESLSPNSTLLSRHVTVCGHALRGPPTPPPNGLGSRPLPPPCCGLNWEFPWFGGWPLGSAGVDGVESCGPFRAGSPGGLEASLVRQSIFCGRKLCSETLGCQTLEIPVRDYTIYSNRVRPYDLKAPNNLLYTVPYNVHYIL